MKPISGLKAASNQPAKINREGGMCRFFGQSKLGSSAFALGVACLFGLATVQTALANFGCGPCPANRVGVGCNSSVASGPNYFDAATNAFPVYVIPGETVFFNASAGPNFTSCCHSGGVLTAISPHNTSTIQLSGTQIPFTCPDTLQSCELGAPSSVQGVLLPYTVDPNDTNLANAVETEGNGPGSCGLAGIPHIAFSSTYRNGFSCSASAATASGQGSVCAQILFPCLSVTTMVACEPANGDCSQASYSKSATGFIADQSVASFCYSITVTNCGTDPLIITNITDNVLSGPPYNVDFYTLFLNNNPNTPNNELFPATGSLAVPGAATAVTIFFNVSETVGETNTVTVTSFENGTGLGLPLPPATDSANVTPVASFSGSPANGCAPLIVTFTDTSTGLITNRFWSFGDGGTTNLATNSVVYAYNTVSVYTVSEIVTGPYGVSTNMQPNYIKVVSCPTITGIAREGSNIRVMWTSFGGQSYALQSTKSTAMIAGYTTNFAD